MLMSKYLLDSINILFLLFFVFMYIWEMPKFLVTIVAIDACSHIVFSMGLPKIYGSTLMYSFRSSVLGGWRVVWLCLVFGCMVH